MQRVTLRSLWLHKRRLISTIVAIVLGVAFMSGTFVFADTLDKVFDDLFANRSEEVDAQVQGEVLFSDDFGGGDVRKALPQPLLDTVRAVDGVAAAEPYILTLGFGSSNRVLDAAGDPVGVSQGPPTLLESWIPDETLNPYVLVEGSRAPEANNEMALNVAAAEDGEFEVGDTITVSSQFGNRDYTLVGLVRFGEADSSAGAVSAEFTLAEAQFLAGVEGEVAEIWARAVDGTSPEELVANIEPVLPDQSEVITGEQAAAQMADNVQSGFAFFRVALSVFAGIALLVGIFLIYNTFSILVAQRTRELALLRAVGASRRQVLSSVLLEALVVGLIAGVLGLLAGIALAAGVRALIEAFGADFPSSGLVVKPGTVVWSAAVGMIVTMVAAIVPAVRATRVPPLAALRDVAIERTGPSKVRLGIGVFLLVFAAVQLSAGWRTPDDTDVVPTVGLGALLAVIGAIVIGPLLATPTVRLLGGVLPRFRGVAGRLAMENAARHPKRTSATAAAVLIGVALVSFIMIFAASAKESVAQELGSGLNADLIVQSEAGFAGPPSGFSPEVAARIAALDEVDQASALGFGAAKFTYPDGHDSETFIIAIDPSTVGSLFNPRMAEGSLADLTDDGIAVDRQTAEDNQLAIGDVIAVTGPNGTPVDLTIQVVSDDLLVLGPWTITRATFASITPQPLDAQVYLDVADGVDIEQARQAIEEAVSFVPALEVLDEEQFENDLVAQVTTFVNVIYGMLAMSIIIALIGVGNTLSLSIHERTREIGLLRAVGMVRGQLQSAIRWEAVLISVLGTLVGIGLGLVASRAILKALESFGLRQFTLPTTGLIIVVVLAALFGVLASLPSTRRAARLDILKAISTE